jgi:hypothetical protein
MKKVSSHGALAGRQRNLRYRQRRCATPSLIEIRAIGPSFILAADSRPRSSPATAQTNPTQDGSGLDCHVITTPASSRLSEAKRLRALEDENGRLKRLLADAMLDNAGLKDLLAKKW